MTTSLAGTLQVWPGRPVPNIVRQRPRGLARLWRGQPADALPGLLGALFTLCGHAHRSVARRAVAAARGDAQGLSIAEQRDLHWQTVREHARSVTLAWAALAGAPPGPALQALRRAPVVVADPGDAGLVALPAWLAHEVLGMPAAQWLEQVGMHGEAWLAAWCERAPTPTAEALRTARTALRGVQVASAPLELGAPAAASLPLQRPHAWAASTEPLQPPQAPTTTASRLAPATAAHLARQLGSAQTEAFVAAPETALGCADTGPWSRAADRPRASHQNAWMLLAHRLVDLVQLGVPGSGLRRLASGACNAAPGEGLAWAETARGLLVHWVRLDGAERVAACQVLAPTDWNGHPAGALAQALAGTRSAAAAEWLVAAFDPCVPHRVVVPVQEPAHA